MKIFLIIIAYYISLKRSSKILFDDNVSKTLMNTNEHKITSFTIELNTIEIILFVLEFLHNLNFQNHHHS